MSRRGLTRKQQRFVEEYLRDLNATQAAIRAGYSARNADKIGSQLVGKTRVAEAIAAAQTERSEKTRITAARVLQGLLKEATLEGKGSSPAARVQAWGLLGKHLALFVERTRLEGGITVGVVEELIDAAVKGTSASHNGEAARSAVSLPQE